MVAHLSTLLPGTATEWASTVQQQEAASLLLLHARSHQEGPCAGLPCAPTLLPCCPAFLSAAAMPQAHRQPSGNSQRLPDLQEPPKLLRSSLAVMEQHRLHSSMQSPRPNGHDSSQPAPTRALNWHSGALGSGDLDL